MQLIILASGPSECAAIDVDSGAFVRGYWPTAVEPGRDAREPAGVREPAGDLALLPYWSASAVIGRDDAPFDPSRPEAVPFERPPQQAGQVPHRKVRGYLEALMAPSGIPLLGFLGPSIRFWQMSGTHPSVSLLRPTQGPQLLVEHGTVKARFEWDGLRHCLMVSDHAVCSAALAAGAPRLSGDALAAALGYRPRYVLVVLTRPHEGYCHKSVGAILPKP